jgi:hypothetical protein
MCRLALICAGYSRRKWGAGAAGSNAGRDRAKCVRRCLLSLSREAVGSSSSLPLSLPRKAWGRDERSSLLGWRIVSAAKRCVGWGWFNAFQMAAASFARLGPHPTGLRPATLPTKNGGGIRGSEFAARRPRRLVVLLLQGPSRERRGAATRNPTGRRN